MVQSKYQSVANQKSQETFQFSIIFWNAGGLNEIKILEFENLLHQHDPDAFAIIDAGSFSEKEDKLTKYFKNFQLKTKKRDRKTSSGMILGVKKELTCKFRTEKEMTNADRLEAVSATIWKRNQKIPFVAMYNPPNNVANYRTATD